MNISIIAAEDIGIHKKDLRAEQWKHLTETDVKEKYVHFYKIFTHTSKPYDNTGIGYHGSKYKKSLHWNHQEMHISNAEIVARPF